MMNTVEVKYKARLSTKNQSCTLRNGKMYYDIK
jgi:hypothetical protein